MEYNIFLNKGNEYLGSDKSVSVNEHLRVASDRLLAREIHHLNELIPENIAQAVLEYLVEAAANLMAQGYAVNLKYDGQVAVRFYGDIHVKGGNINLARAQELIPGTTDLTLENAGELVNRAGVTARARVDAENRFTELLLSLKEPITRISVVERDKITKSEDSDSDTSTGTQDTSTNTEPSGDDGLGG